MIPQEQILEAIKKFASTSLTGDQLPIAYDPTFGRAVSVDAPIRILKLAIMEIDVLENKMPQPLHLSKQFPKDGYKKNIDNVHSFINVLSRWCDDEQVKRLDIMRLKKVIDPQIWGKDKTLFDAMRTILIQSLQHLEQQE